MAITIEDGSGISDANSYVSAADAAAYFAWRSVGGFPNDQTAAEYALKMGTRYIEDAFHGRWKGVRTHQTQGLAWPRAMQAPTGWWRRNWVQPQSFQPILDIDGYPIQPNEIPKRVVWATYEAALLSAQGVPLVVTKSPSIKSTSRTADRVSYSNEYGAPFSQRDQRLIAIDNMLVGLVLSAPGSTSGSVRLVRG